MISSSTEPRQPRAILTHPVPTRNLDLTMRRGRQLGLVCRIVVAESGPSPSPPPLTPPVREIRAVLSARVSPQPTAAPLRASRAPSRSPADIAQPIPDLPRWVPQDGVVPRAAGPATSQAAPPPPTAEAWAFASSYTPRNGKAYRHSWAQQVRSQMGTAVEGPDQGAVRFRVEITPNGTLARLDTVWSTSPVAERLARDAMAAMPRWPAPLRTRLRTRGAALRQPPRLGRSITPGSSAAGATRDPGPGRPG